MKKKKRRKPRTVKPLFVIESVPELSGRLANIDNKVNQLIAGLNKLKIELELLNVIRNPT